MLRLGQLVEAIPVAGDMRVSRPEDALLSHLGSVWTRNKDHKREKGIDEAMLESLYAYRGEYTPSKKAAITQENMPVVYMGISGVKARAAVAWLSDLYSMQQTWSLTPTPVPEIPEESLMDVAQKLQMRAQEDGRPPTRREVEAAVVREAKRAADSQAEVLSDQLVEAEFEAEFAKFRWDLVVMKVGVLRGPVTVRTKQRQWDPATKRVIYVDQDTPRFFRVSPLDCFPSPDDDSFRKDFVERQRFEYNGLEDMREERGFRKEAIDKVLADFNRYTSDGDLDAVDSQRAELEQKLDPSMRVPSPDSCAKALAYWVTVPGSMISGILDQNLDQNGELIKPNRRYDIEAIVVGDQLVYLGLNPDPLGRKPYITHSWSPEIGSFWGQGVIDLMSGLQSICNASVRSLVKNMSFSSGPQTVINDISRLAEGENIAAVYGGRVWQFTNRGNSTAPPVQFTKVDSNASELIDVYQRFAQMSDDFTGIPAYTYGNDRVAGAGRTYSGLSVLMSNAAKGIKRVIHEIDQKVVARAMSMLVDWNLAYNQAFLALGGDVKVRVEGAIALMVKEALSERRMEFLRSTANEFDSQVLGIRGRALLLKEAAIAVEIPGEELIPDIEQIEDETRAARAAQQAAEQQKMQADQMVAEAKAQLQQAQIMKLQAEVQQAQVTAQTKVAELQLAAAEAQSKAQIESAKLKLEADRAEAQTRIEMARIELEQRKAGSEHGFRSAQDLRESQAHELEYERGVSEYIDSRVEKEDADQKSESGGGGGGEGSRASKAS